MVRWRPGAIGYRLTGSIKKFTMDTKALGLVGLEKKLFRILFFSCKNMETNNLQGGAFDDPWARLAGFMLHILNIVVLGFMVLEKILSCIHAFN